MNKVQIILTILIAAIIAFALRALPFAVFRNGRRMPEKLIYLGNILPSAIMAVLIIYCLKNVAIDFEKYGIPELTAVFLVAVSYKWKHNMLLSIVLGTVCSMLLLNM